MTVDNKIGSREVIQRNWEETAISIYDRRKVYYAKVEAPGGTTVYGFVECISGKGNDLRIPIKYDFDTNFWQRHPDATGEINHSRRSDIIAKYNAKQFENPEDDESIFEQLGTTVQTGNVPMIRCSSTVGSPVNRHHLLVVIQGSHPKEEVARQIGGQLNWKVEAMTQAELDSLKS